jgi:hypothetical protein
MRTKFPEFLACVVCLMAGSAWAQSSVTVTLGAQAPGAAIPSDFLGLSFGMKTLLPDKSGGHFFSPANTALVTLFQNIGIRHLRLGGTTVEWPPTVAIPNEKDVDSVFAFARTAHVEKIIYSLPLLETNASQNYAATNAAIASYIWDHYRPLLDSFSIGNEPDRRTIFVHDAAITNFSTYLRKWRRFAAAITNAVPDAKLCGPDAGSGNVSWTTHFARAEKDAGMLGLITEHFYAGGAGRGVSAEQGLDDMLSTAWITRNQGLYDNMAAPVLADGLPYRFTEANDHYSGGVRDASNTFAGALWALDFLHWWAAHETRGVDFHNTQWVVNDVITHDTSGRVMPNPKAYGLKAFGLGSHGNIEQVTVSNPDGINLTAYAVRGADAHFVTLINKEHGSAAREAKVTLAAPGAAKAAAIILLASANGDAAAEAGVTLGGATISADGPWRGKWAPLTSREPGQYLVNVPAVSAALVRIPLQNTQRQK